MPSVVVLTTVAESLADPKFRVDFPRLDGTRTPREPERILRLGTSMFHVHIDNTGANPPAVLLPFDKLFDIRAAAAVRLWRALLDRDPGRNPAALSQQRCNRLIRALRALDARFERASYRQIAEALFHLERMPASNWKTHALRDQTIRLVRLGRGLMNGGYRNLLLHPYRYRA